MPSQAARRTLLVVEDDDDTREIFTLTLTRAGHTVVATRDPAAARDLAAAHAPDLVLCDIAMPGMDGYRVLDVLKADPATRSFPVVFLTARSEFNERVRAFQLGVTDFITKPIAPAALVSRVERILQGLAAGGRAGAGEAGETASDAGLARDPPRLPAAGPLPDFGQVPEPLRDVIVADDNASFRASLAEALSRRGFRVREAKDGAELVRQATDAPPWLVIVDARMPMMDGIEACRRLRAHVLTRHLPVVCLSGWDDADDRSAALDAGADEFLPKQASLRELLVRIQVLMRRYARGRANEGPVVEGRLDVVGAPAALQMCHLLGLTGTLEAADAEGPVAIGFVEGRVTTARAPGLEGTRAVFHFLAMPRGRFSFLAGPPEPGPEVRDDVAWLVLEGCRRIDERGLTA